MRQRYDAVVVGAGPNGLAAAIEMARAGRSTLLMEAQATIGGGARSADLTLPGFVNDFGSAIHPLAAASPFFRTLPLAEHGLEWVYSPAAVAHPLDDGRVALLRRSIAETAATLNGDAGRYQFLIRPQVSNWDSVAGVLLGPPRPTRHLLRLGLFGLLGLQSVTSLARLFKGAQARALLSGLGAHSFLPLGEPPSAAFALVLAILAHTVDWPFPRGGAQHISDALAGIFRSLGGEIVTDAGVQSLADVPSARTILFDVTPRQLARIAGDRLPPRYLRKLQGYRYGPGAFKLDYALSGPIPWKFPQIAEAATVHLGGTLEEVARSEWEVSRGRHPERPFVLLAQHTLFDPTRAPAGKHTAWAYCHVPNGSTVDMTERIERQIERFAPGFRDLILDRHAMGPAELEARDANLVGGDINGGLQDFRQLFTRPMLRLNPYSTPVPGLYICSSSTPPGGGVHGLCGYWAAHAALTRSW